MHPTVVMSNAVHVYVSQAHKGELVMGAGIDSYNGYGQRGAFHIIERQMAAALELFPIFARAHLLRTWGGIVDVTPDASPIVGLTPVEGLYLNCGWGTGGFKATPGVGWCFAHTIANDEPAPLQRPLHPGAVRHRRPRRRARRRRRGPLRDRGVSMLLIPCPCCGPRDETEYHYGGQAHVAYPTDTAALSDAEWADFLFFRDNPKGPFAERWLHATGCRRWFNAIRDTATHQMLAVYRLDEPKPVICMSSTFRLPEGGRVDRDATGLLHLQRPELPAFVATPWPRPCSPTVSTGSRRASSCGRPRGIMAAGVEDPNALVQVETPFPEPMLTATTVELYDGLVARGLPGQGRLADRPTRPATTPCTRTATCSSSAPGRPGSPPH